MSLYDNLAASYDLVFPLRPAKVAYAASLAERSAGAVLDIGCATGSLAIELARRGHIVTGIDLDEEMVRIAAARARESSLPAAFEALDMRHIAAHFAAATYGTILCLGNTIVHVSDAEAVGAFLRAVRLLLAPGGRVAVQLVNYDRVLSGHLPGLPTIETEHVRFSRSYRLDSERRRIVFCTSLTVKSSGAVRQDETKLYPLTRAELMALLGDCGMAVEAVHADFTGRAFAVTDEALIVVARPA